MSVRSATRTFALVLALSTSTAFHVVPYAVSSLQRARFAASTTRNVCKWTGGSRSNELRSIKMQDPDDQRKSTSLFAAKGASRKKQRQASLFTGMSLFDSFASSGSPKKVSAAAGPPVGGSVNVPPRDDNKGAVLAAAIALGSGMLAWAVEQGGTFCIVEAMMKSTGTDSIRTLVEFMTAWASAAQWQGMVVSTGVATVLQLLPLCNGILLMMMLGSMYGTAKGVAVASAAATFSALICMLTARHLLRAKFAGKEPELMKAVASSIACSDAKSLFIVTLFRLSPVVPFCWSNYLFGLTEVRVMPYVAGTFLGALPAISAFVSAGTLAKNIAAGSASAPPGLLALGLAATLAVLATIGKISQQELDKIAASDRDDVSSAATSPTQESSKQ